MKSGTGDDPFADDAATDADAADDVDATPDESAETTASAASDAERDAEDASSGSDAEGSTAASESDADSAGSDDSADADGESSADAEATDASADGDDEGTSDDAPDIPWVLRRSSVKADRPNVTQFFLRDETDRAERRFQSDVEDILDADVYTLDLREAAYLVAMRHPEEVADELRDWGYEYME